VNANIHDRIRSVKLKYLYKVGVLFRLLWYNIYLVKESITSFLQVYFIMNFWCNEESCFMWYNSVQSVENRPPFQRNMSTPFKSSKVSHASNENEEDSKQVCKLLTTCFLLVSCLAYSPTLKMEVACSCEISVNFNGRYGAIFQKIRLFITTAVKISNSNISRTTAKWSTCLTNVILL
jgi:hypothetical protein